MVATLDLVLLALPAAGMATLTAIVVRWAAFTTSPLRAGVVEFLLLMMTGMFLGILTYFALGGAAGLVAGFWVAGAIMSASVLVVFLPLFGAQRRSEAAGLRPSQLAGQSRFVAVVIGLVLANEFLMGWSFSLLAGALPVGFGPGGDHLGAILAGAVVSPWFVFPMALEMGLSLRWLLEAVPAPMRRYLLIQPAAMICSPPTIAGLPWAVSTAVGASALMAVAVAFLLLTIARGEDVPHRVFGFAWRLIATFGLMAVGLYAWAIYGNSELFAISLLLQMVLFLHASTRPTWYAESMGTVGSAPPIDARAADSSRG
jgi:hypothetical protein